MCSTKARPLLYGGVAQSTERSCRKGKDFVLPPLPRGRRDVGPADEPAQDDIHSPVQSSSSSTSSSDSEDGVSSVPELPSDVDMEQATESGLLDIESHGPAPSEDDLAQDFERFLEATHH